VSAGPRDLAVDAARVSRWVVGFGDRHGSVQVSARPTGARLVAADGAVAELASHWPGALDADRDPVAAVIHQALRRRRSAVLLVRRGGYACAVIDGTEVVASKVGTRYVQGRTAAGGWSQQRFDRRREKQTDELVGSVIRTAVRLLAAERLDALVTGGDHPLVDRVLAEPKLATVAGLPRGSHLPVGDPRIDLVRELPRLLQQVRIRLTEPQPGVAT
jgi:hypothetical protein